MSSKLVFPPLLAKLAGLFFLLFFVKNITKLAKKSSERLKIKINRNDPTAQWVKTF